MDFAFGDEQEELRRYAAQWLADHATSADVRRISETETGYDAAQWKSLADMGWLGMAIPEDLGGAGFGFMEQAVLLEEQGRTLFPSPFLATTILAANLIEWVGSETQKTEWLPRIVNGDAIATVAITEGSKDWDLDSIQTSVVIDSDDLVVRGEKRHVLNGHNADLVVVVAAEDDGLSVLAIPSGSDGLSVSRDSSMDATRPQATIGLDDVRVPSTARIGAPGEMRGVLASVRRRAMIGQALEQVGGAERCLRMSVDYAMSRKQFGRPIGSFQAIKHMCADMFVAVEAARAAAYYAAWAETTGADDVDSVADVAKAYCSDAFRRCAADTIQIHGGIGFTWEHDAHLYFKRAETSALMFGDSHTHRRALAERIGL